MPNDTETFRDRRYAEIDRELEAMDALWTELPAFEHRAAVGRLLDEQDEVEWRAGEIWRAERRSYWPPMPALT